MKDKSKPPVFAVVSIALMIVIVIALVLATTVTSSGAGENNDPVKATSSNATPPREPSSTAPKTGEAAPDFRLPYATQEQIFLKPEEHMALSALRGKNVILAFYPADWSSGCTKEVCTLRDTFAELSKLNATVLGISGDYVFSHHEWAKFHKLQFALLSDHDHKVAKAYGSYNEARSYNHRTVFLVDKTGIIRYSNLEFKAGDPKDYATLRAELGKLK